MQRRTVVVPPAFINHRRSVFLPVRLGLRALGKPCSLCDPLPVELPRLRNRKQALRNAGAERLVDHAEIQRHRHRVGLVGIGIVKLAVNHDRDGNDARLALVVDLNEPQRARPVIGVLALLVLGKLLPWQRLCRRANQADRGADDGAEALAI